MVARRRGSQTMRRLRRRNVRSPSDFLPSNNPTANAPLKASPAAVVSTAFTGIASSCSSKASVARYAPRAPIFSRMPSGPLRQQPTRTRTRSGLIIGLPRPFGA